MIKEKLKEHKKALFIFSGVSIFTILFFTSGIFLFDKTYNDFIYPNIEIGGIKIGGLSKISAHEKLENSLNSMLDDGLWIKVQDDQAFINLRLNTNNDADLAHDLIYLNIDEEIDNAFALGRNNNWFINHVTRIKSLFLPKNITPAIIIDDEQISQLILDRFETWEDPMVLTTYKINNTDDELTIEIATGKDGMGFDIPNSITNLQQDATDFHLEIMNLKLNIIKNYISVEDAESFVSQIRNTIENAPYELTFTSPTERSYNWTITSSDLSSWLALSKINNNPLTLVMQGDDYNNFIKKIHDDVDTKPIDARFNIEGNRVTEFEGSIDGTIFDEESTLTDLMAKLGQNDVELPITVSMTSPDITTGSINNLGITEILGVGTSDFSHSTANRISNIKHGADKLNGLLIAPGETLSLIEKLKPFTITDGYLPELVIKGDEIKAEVGGGLCQIGTTTFRAVMNSGLEVIERRNHSLVVSYYNDPTNGNPGTDATIYDPAPDFKFKNDTENYILFATEVDVPNRELIFTFWGTSDGRIGSYTPPIVLSWSGYGPTEYTQTTDLNPGVIQCQYAHSGATTSFDYNVEYANGETFSKTFTSVYRSLPKICLVGVDTLSSDCADSGECTSDSSDFTNNEEAPTEEATGTDINTETNSEASSVTE